WPNGPGGTADPGPAHRGRARWWRWRLSPRHRVRSGYRPAGEPVAPRSSLGRFPSVVRQIRVLRLGVFLSHDSAVAVAEEAERPGEYVEIVRTALRGEPVRYAGRHYRLPPDGTTEAANLHAAPVRADLPVYLAAVGPASLELAGRVADGWIGVFCPPERVVES